MHSTRQFLINKKKELEEQLKPLLALQQELNDVIKALEIMDGVVRKEQIYSLPDCPYTCPGCDNCRRGPHYR